MRRFILTASAVTVVIIVLIAISLNRSENPVAKDRPISVVMANEDKSCPFCKNEPKPSSTLSMSVPSFSDEAKTPAIRSAISNFIDKTKYALRLDSVSCGKSICTAQISTTMIIDDHGMPFYQSLMFKDFLEPAHVSSLEASTTSMEEGMKRYELTLHMSEPV